MSRTLPKSRYSIKIRRTEYSYELATTLLISCSRPIPSPLPSRFLSSSSDIHTGSSLHPRRNAAGTSTLSGRGSEESFNAPRFPPTLFPQNIRKPPHTRQHVTRRLYPLEKAPVSYPATSPRSRALKVDAVPSSHGGDPLRRRLNQKTASFRLFYNEGIRSLSHGPPPPP